jgi:hypothetical protein
VQVNPSSLIAKSNQSSTITATVADAFDNRVPGIPLAGTLSSSSLGTVSALGSTNSTGQATGTWTATPGSRQLNGLGNVARRGSYLTDGNARHHRIVSQPDLCESGCWHFSVAKERWSGLVRQSSRTFSSHLRKQLSNVAALR